MVQIPILDLGPAPCLFLSTQAPPTCCSNLRFLARSNQSAERAATLPASEGGSMLEQLFRADPNMFLPWRSQGSREKPTQARGEGVTSTQKSTSLDLTSDFLLCNIVAIQRLSVRNPDVWVTTADHSSSNGKQPVSDWTHPRVEWPRLQMPNLTGWQHFEISVSLCQWTQLVGNSV